MTYTLWLVDGVSVGENHRTYLLERNRVYWNDGIQCPTVDSDSIGRVTDRVVRVNDYLQLIGRLV